MTNFVIKDNHGIVVMYLAGVGTMFSELRAVSHSLSMITINKG